MQRSAIADTICRTIELGVTITDAALDGEDRTHVFCQVLEPKNICPGCARPGRLRDHIDREVADLPIVGHPTRLHIAVGRYLCENPDCVTTIFRADISTIVAPRAQVTRSTTTWILRAMIVDKMSVKAVAAAVGLSWNTVNTLALEAARSLASAPARLDGVRVLGVDEHKWKHVRGKRDSSFVTVLVDLTPIVDGTGPARLLDMVAGRSKAALKNWLTARDPAFRDRIKVVTMDGFSGYRTATAETLDKARAVMDPFHVVHLAADKLTVCRQRVQQDTCGHRGRSGDPLYGVRRHLLTRIGLLTDKQKTRINSSAGLRHATFAIHGSRPSLAGEHFRHHAVGCEDGLSAVRGACHPPRGLSDFIGIARLVGNSAPPRRAEVVRMSGMSGKVAKVLVTNPGI